MKKYLKDLFTQQFGSFLIKQGYTENKNSFAKLYNDIFARVYLLYHYDKNYDELQFDVIHSFTPLIFEIDTKCICEQINLSYIRYLSRYSETDFALKNDSYNSLYFEKILLIQFVTSDLSVASAIYSSPDKRLNEKSSSPS